MPDKKTFFISRAGPDKRWADLIASVVRDAGHEAIHQDEHFAEGTSFSHNMMLAAESDCTIVIRADAAMILLAVRRIGTKFKGKWDLKKHRAWYDKRQPKDQSRRHQEGTWEECLARTKRQLLAAHWVFSWWAMAWLEIARQRGMTEIFDPKHRSAFSE
jgi:hypothetical protein